MSGAADASSLGMKWVRYLVYPALALAIAGVILLFVRSLGIGGIIAGGLMFAAAVDMFFIGASRPRPA